MRYCFLKILLLITLLVNTTVFALDTSIDTSKTEKTDREQSQSLRKTKEQRDTKGKRKADTTATGVDKQTQEAVKAIGQAMSQGGADVTLSLEAVFLDRIALLEEDVEPFRTCKIITKPRLPRDFGLSAEVSRGVIDTIKAEYLSKAAQSNSYVRDVADERELIQYRNCLAAYGAIIAQAYLYLASDLDDIKAGVSKDKDGNIEIRGIGYDDFVVLADLALQRALHRITNSTIERTYERLIQDSSACQFDRSIENIKCGSSLIILSSRPQLYISGVEWYGERFAGFQGTFKVSKAWSYQNAIEKLKSTSRYSRFAHEVSQYAEELESQGKAKEAMLVRKKAWELAKSGKQAISPNRLLAGQ
ncbi:MAG: hypothetical protein QW561_03910 [Candidatus Aenigmatarchaeota archaeon]